MIQKWRLVKAWTVQDTHKWVPLTIRDYNTIESRRGARRLRIIPRSNKVASLECALLCSYITIARFDRETGPGSARYTTADPNICNMDKLFRMHCMNK